jgi:hypothetical protein
MNESTQQMMKHFATVLRKRSSEKQLTKQISPDLIQYLSRKELINIISRMHGGTIPEEHNLVELENDGLLKLIGDELYIIAYVTEQWSKETVAAPPPVKTAASGTNLEKNATGTPAAKNDSRETAKKQDEKKL